MNDIADNSMTFDNIYYESETLDYFDSYCNPRVDSIYGKSVIRTIDDTIDSYTYFNYNESIDFKTENCSAILSLKRKNSHIL